MEHLISGDTSRPATMRDLESYDRMRQQSKQAVPVLQSQQNAHEYLFVALFDGMSQDVHDPTQSPTNVGELQRQRASVRQAPARR